MQKSAVHRDSGTLRKVEKFRASFDLTFDRIWFSLSLKVLNSNLSSKVIRVVGIYSISKKIQNVELKWQCLLHKM